MKLSLVVGKHVQQAEEFPVNAPRRGDNRGEGSATRILFREARPILADLEFYAIGRVCIAFDDEDWVRFQTVFTLLFLLNMIQASDA